MNNPLVAPATQSRQPSPPNSRSGGVPDFVWLIGVALFAVASSFLFQTQDGQRVLLVIAVFGGLSMLLTFSPSVGVPALLIYLAFLGGVRRWLIPVLGWPQADPLLLVAPLLAILFFLNLLPTRRLPTEKGLPRLLNFLLVIMAVQIVNPLQGGLAVGIAGALFYIVPVMWFYLGYFKGSSALLRRLFLVAGGISILAAIYGLYQTWFGYLPSEEQWVQLTHMQALHVGDGNRAFAFFTFPAEYDWFLCLGIIIFWAAFLRGKYAALLPIPLLGLAVFFESGRGPIVSTLAACVALWAIQGRSLKVWLPRGALALALAVTGLVFSLQQAQQIDFSPQAQELVNHQTSGLLDPTNAKTSTAGVHTGMILNGFAEGFKTPIGKGLGATTIAAQKFGAGEGSTELDLSNMFVSLGLVGGFLYLAIVGLIFIKAIRYWHQTRTGIALVIVGILFLNFGQWLNGGQYSIAFLIWFCIGTLDRMDKTQTIATGEPPQLAVDAPGNWPAP